MQVILRILARIPASWSFMKKVTLIFVLTIQQKEKVQLQMSAQWLIENLDVCSTSRTMTVDNITFNSSIINLHQIRSLSSRSDVD